MDSKPTTRCVTTYIYVTIKKPAAIALANRFNFTGYDRLISNYTLI